MYAKIVPGSTISEQTRDDARVWLPVLGSLSNKRRGTDRNDLARVPANNDIENLDWTGWPDLHVGEMMKVVAYRLQ
jgi:hypothetical protein